jgi:8-oxo-dGTP diphosphatase
MVADPAAADLRSVQASEARFLANYDRREFLAPLTTVDMAIFSIINDTLHVLLVRRSNYPAKAALALPGGFIDETNDVDVAATAHRKLVEKTGVVSPYLEQVETIGNATRDPRGWSVTVLYFALVDRCAVTADEHIGNEPISWVPIERALVTPLAFDHSLLLQKALDRLRSKTRYSALPVRLMPAVFTLGELQKVFEIALGSTLEKKSFRRRVLDAKVVIETGEIRASGHRPAALFRAGDMNDDFVFPRQLEI